MLALLFVRDQYGHEITPEERAEAAALLPVAGPIAVVGFVLYLLVR